MSTPQRFTLTDEHVSLLQAANIGWCDAEWGAPCIDPKRPYGNGDIWRDMHRILDGGEWDQKSAQPADLTPREWHETVERYRALHSGLRSALAIVIAQGITVALGDYEDPEGFGRSWVRCA